MNRNRGNVIKKIMLNVVLNSRGKWKNERKWVSVRDKSVFNNIDVCLAGTPNIDVWVLEQLYVYLANSAKENESFEIWVWRMDGKNSD
jgi:hypothetical protein